jgi:hypothetical protein
MIRAWNKNMANRFVATWVMCLDESMSIWHNKWKYPGWIFCPCKSHPFGNEQVEVPRMDILPMQVTPVW